MEIVRLHAFTDNYIWGLRSEGRIAVVDPGEAQPVLDYLARSGDRLSAVLLTHHHSDHIGGTEALRTAAREGLTVFGPAVEHIACVDHPLQGGESFSVPGIGVELQVLSVPGHTRGHLAYYRPGMVFCGDTLFTLGCGRLFEGSPAQMWQSLNTLAALPGDTQVYCAHEYTHLNLPFALDVEPGNPALQARAQKLRQWIAAGVPTVPVALEEELATNVFLRPAVPEVIAAARRHSGKADLAQPVEVFAALREWRNGYKPAVI